MTKEQLPKPILIEDLGMRFPTKNSKERKRFGRYQCGFCGVEFTTDSYGINSGNTKSCGCYRKKIKAEGTNRKHSIAHTKLYRIWAAIKNRVYNTKNNRYYIYGGKGITMCDEWKRDAKAFYNWAMENGYSEGLSIDRIDNAGNYEPNNCRWTTSTIQCRNQGIRKDNKSGYKGVFFHKRDKKFTTYITVNKRRISLGYFQTAVEGAIAYNNYIVENNLEGFILNEIPDKLLTND